MGEYLLRVDLGRANFAVDVCVGAAFTCVLLNSRDVKCWGDVSMGQRYCCADSKLNIMLL